RRWPWRSAMTMRAISPRRSGAITGCRRARQARGPGTTRPPARGRAARPEEPPAAGPPVCSGVVEGGELVHRRAVGAVLVGGFVRVLVADGDAADHDLVGGDAQVLLDDVRIVGQRRLRAGVQD